MLRPSSGRVILGGAIATAIMTALVYAAPLMGLPKLDIAAMIGSLANGLRLPAEYTGLWWGGMIVHLLMGIIILPLVYEWTYPMFAGDDWVRGLTYGFVLWLLFHVIVTPVLGMGFFAANVQNQMTVVTVMLAVHLVYGAILGAVAGHSTGEEQVGGTDRLSHA